MQVVRYRIRTVNLIHPCYGLLLRLKRSRHSAELKSFQQSLDVHARHEPRMLPVPRFRQAIRVR